MGRPATSSRRVSRWRDVSQIRRADLYLRTSLYVLLWSVVGFVGFAVVERVEAAGSVPVVVTLGVTVLVACMAGTAVLREVIALHPAPGPLPWRSLVPLGSVLVAAVVIARVVGGDSGNGLVPLVLIAVAMSAGGLTDRRAPAVLGAAFVLAPLIGSGSVAVASVSLAYGAFLVFTVRSSLWLYGVIEELDRARTAQSALAVAEERLRFSRDVHDVMGRRLSTIAVQAELASTLARRGDERAAEQMLEVRGVAHEALREARELARGYRETDLDSELEGARSLLASAGIACDVAVVRVPEEWREPAALVVREAVTNVLRHSRATRVRIAWSPAGLSVTDDGGRSGATGGGSGLAGLAERVAPLGARLEVGPTEEGFGVRMLTGERSEESTEELAT